MSNHMTARREGVTIIEVIFSIAIFSLVAVAAAEHIGLSWSYTDMNRDRIFAYRRAQSILTELQAVVDRGEAEVASDLDQYDDGAGTNHALTITKIGGSLVDPSHPASQNSQTANSLWRWSRQVSVRTFPGQQTRDVRLVTVRIFRNSKDGRQTRFAEMSSVIRTDRTSAIPTTQVYDVYLLAHREHSPDGGCTWTRFDPSSKRRSHGSRSRVTRDSSSGTHWITKAGYGRDPFYSPYTNETQVHRPIRFPSVILLSWPHARPDPIPRNATTCARPDQGE